MYRPACAGRCVTRRHFGSVRDNKHNRVHNDPRKTGGAYDATGGDGQAGKQSDYCK